MDYTLQQTLHELEDFIKQTKLEPPQRIRDSIISDADLDWSASRFIAQVINNAQPFEYYKTYSDFLDFKNEYQLQNATVIDDHSLFERYWLRNVLGFVNISGTISSLCYRFNEIKKYKNELLFWLDFQENHIQDEKINTDQESIKAAVKNYEKVKRIKLKTEGIYLNKWASLEDGIVKCSDFKIYFKQYIDYWDDFKFLDSFNEILRKNQSLKIDAKEFTILHTKFKKFYTKTPSIKELTQQKLIKKSREIYELNFYDTNLEYWGTLKDKISGLLWELILEDNKYKNDYERLKVWLTKVMYWSGWPNPLEYTNEKSKAIFLQTAYELITNEPDLVGKEKEFVKVCYDVRNSHDNLLVVERHILSKRFLLESPDLFEMLRDLSEWEELAHITYLHDQRSRRFIAFLISVIVSNEGKNYEKTIELLLQGSNKPFLLWETTKCILHKNTEIIPHLLITSKLETLGLLILDDVSYAEKNNAEFNVKLWKKSIDLFLQNVPRILSEDRSKIIFQLFQCLNNKKYQIAYNKTDHYKSELKQTQEKKEREILIMLEESCFDVKRYPVNDKEYLLPTIFNELVKHVINYSIRSLYDNGIVQFPFAQWDMMSWLFKISTYWKYQKQMHQMQEGLSNLTDSFLKCYLENIELSQIEKYSYLKGETEIITPLWNEKIERLQFIDWLFPIYFMNEYGYLNQFLNPRIKIIRTKDRYHKDNQLSGDKIRTHIGVLLQVLKQLMNPTLPYGLDISKIQRIKKSIEFQIVDYLKKHLENRPDIGKIDLFGYDKEWSFHESGSEALLPQIARAINWFSNKDSIIDTIAETKDITKLLTLLDHVKSEGVKYQIIEKIKEQDIKEFLSDYTWIPEIQFTVANISNYPELLPQIEDAVAFWKESVMTRRSVKDYEFVLFKTELLIAYFKNSEEAIEEANEPQNSFDSRDLKPLDYKSFYKGLLYIDKEPLKAHSIFDRLVKLYPSYPSFALNRMVSKIAHGKQSWEIGSFYEAQEEWKDAEKSLKENAVLMMEPQLSQALMTIHSKTQNYDLLNERYRSLDLLHRMNPSCLEIMIESLIEQSKITDALVLINAAKKYHQFGNVTDIHFVSELEKKISGIDNIEELKIYYSEIFRSDPVKLIKILSEDINGKKDLTEFIVKEITLAADKLLEKIKSIEEIKDEDKYNDLIELAMDARINPWGWHIGAQSRGAFSGNVGIQPGERDLPVMNKSKKVLMVCEAFILRSPAIAKSHLEKVFNYHHNRTAFSILIYDLSTSHTKFEKNWKNYKDNIVTVVKYPEGFEINGLVKDKSEDFGVSNSGIRVAMSKNGDGTFMYHIFVHINYAL
ncbi:MAG: hypothetical protein RSD40_00530 [Bacilli bacterium]